MARIAGVNIPVNKRIVVALTYIYGIGGSLSEKILKEMSINPDTRTKNLTEDEINRLRVVVEKRYVTEGELRRQIADRKSVV